MTQLNQQASGHGHLLTTHEAAPYLGVKSSTLCHWRWEKTGPRYLKVGRAVRYRKEDLDAWLAAQQVEPNQPHNAA